MSAWTWPWAALLLVSLPNPAAARAGADAAPGMGVAGAAPAAADGVPQDRVSGASPVATDGAPLLRVAQAPAPNAPTPVARAESSAPRSAPTPLTQVMPLPRSASTSPTPVVPLPRIEVPLPPSAPANLARRDPTGTTSVVEVEARAGEGRDTAALLSEVPGLLVQQLGGFGQTQSVSLRGASSNGVLVLLDGIPLNGAGGVADLSRLPVAWLSRLEVLRGGAGASHGSGALGGVVNLVTRKLGATPRAEVQLSGGSFGTLQLQGSLAGPLLGGEALLLLHGGRSAGDFPYLHDATPAYSGDVPEERLRANNDSALGGGLLRYRRPLGGALTLEVLGEHTRDARGIAGTVLNPTPGAREAHARSTAAVRLSHAPDEGTELSLRSFLRTDVSTLDAWVAGSQLHAMAGLELEGSTFFADAHGLTAQLSLAREWYQAGQGSVEPVWLRVSLSVMDEWMVTPALTLVPALRVEQAGPFTLLSPKLGAALELPWRLRVRANVGQGHRAPSFLELYVPQGGLYPNANLLPERVLGADLGLEHESASSRVALTGFYSLYENLIAYEFYPPQLPRPYNFAAAEVAGLEASGQLTPWPWLSASAGWTLLFSQNLKDDPRYHLKELPYRPRHRGFGRLEGGPAWLRGHLQVEAQSRQFINRTQTTWLAERTLWHTGVSARFGPRDWPLFAAAEVRNVLDVRAEDFSGFPLPGRSFHLTVGAALEPAAHAAQTQSQERR